ncbi:GIY-YIG nuclease family protein [candidate division KSB1 bacterium]
MPYFVYILYSEKIDRYYIGSSHDPEARLHYHNLGKKGWTKRGIPWEIVFTKEFINKKAAMEKEKYVKSQKDRSYIEKLIAGETDS